MAVRKASQPIDSKDGDPLVTRLERLLAANRQLVEEFERHKAAEAAWRAERALLVAMVNQVPDYLFAKDADGRFLMANKAVAADLGYDQRRRLGRPHRPRHAARSRGGTKVPRGRPQGSGVQAAQSSTSKNT